METASPVQDWESSLFICRCSYMTFPNAIHLHMKVPLFSPPWSKQSLLRLQSSSFTRLELSENHPPSEASKNPETPHFHKLAASAIDSACGQAFWFVAVPLIPNRARRAKLRALHVSHEMAADHLRCKSIFANRPQTHDGSLWSS